MVYCIFANFSIDNDFVPVKGEDKALKLFAESSWCEAIA